MTTDSFGRPLASGSGQSPNATTVNDSKSNGVSTAVVVGAVLGAALCLIAILAVIMCLRRRRKRDLQSVHVAEGQHFPV